MEPQAKYRHFCRHDAGPADHDPVAEAAIKAVDQWIPHVTSPDTLRTQLRHQLGLDASAAADSPTDGSNAGTEVATTNKSKAKNQNKDKKKRKGARLDISRLTTLTTRFLVAQQAATARTSSHRQVHRRLQREAAEAHGSRAGSSPGSPISRRRTPGGGSLRGSKRGSRMPSRDGRLVVEDGGSAMMRRRVRKIVTMDGPNASHPPSHTDDNAATAKPLEHDQIEEGNSLSSSFASAAGSHKGHVPPVPSSAAEQAHTRYMHMLQSCMRRGSLGGDSSDTLGGGGTERPLSVLVRGQLPHKATCISVTDAKGGVRRIARYTATVAQLREVKQEKARKERRRLRRLRQARERTRHGPARLDHDGDEAGAESAASSASSSDGDEGDDDTSDASSSTSGESADQEERCRHGTRTILDKIYRYIEEVKVQDQEIARKITQQFRAGGNGANILISLGDAAAGGHMADGGINSRHGLFVTIPTPGAGAASSGMPSPSSAVAMNTPSRAAALMSTASGLSDRRISVFHPSLRDTAPVWPKQMSDAALRALETHPIKRSADEIQALFDAVTGMPAFATFHAQDTTNGGGGGGVGGGGSGGEGQSGGRAKKGGRAGNTRGGALTLVGPRTAALNAAAAAATTNGKAASVLDGAGAANMAGNSATTIRELCKVAKMVRHSPGSTIFRQGDIGTMWYVVVRGSVDVAVSPPGVSTRIKVATLPYGHGFGELALVNNNPRAATVTCGLPSGWDASRTTQSSDDPSPTQADLIFFTVDKSDYLRIARDIYHKDIQRKMTFLSTVPGLTAVVPADRPPTGSSAIANLASAQSSAFIPGGLPWTGVGSGVVATGQQGGLHAIASVLKWQVFYPGETIMKQGDQVGDFYFVRRGYVDIYRDVVLTDGVPDDEHHRPHLHDMDTLPSVHPQQRMTANLPEPEKKQRVVRVRVARKGPGEYFGEEFVVKVSVSDYLSQWAAEKVNNAHRTRQMEKGKSVVAAVGPSANNDTSVIGSTTSSRVAPMLLISRREAPTFPSAITAKAVGRYLKEKDMIGNNLVAPDEIELPDDPNRLPSLGDDKRPRNMDIYAGDGDDDGGNTVELGVMRIFDGQARIKKALPLSPYYVWDEPQLRAIWHEEQRKVKWKQTRRKVLKDLRMSDFHAD